MKNFLKRIEKLEKRSNAAHEELLKFMEQIEAGRLRVKNYFEANGLPLTSDEGLPPKKVHTSKGIQLYMDILNEGRDRARLRALRDGKVKESGSSATGDDERHESESGQ